MIADEAVRCDEDRFVKTERNRRIVKMHVEDRLTLVQIARVMGISPERVRQLVRRAGVTVYTSAVIRYDFTHTTLICPTCGGSFELSRHLAALRMYCAPSCSPGAPRKYTNDQLLASLRDLAAKLGRTPSQDHMNADPATPSHMAYVKRFGSICEAQRLAGLTPNARGEHARVIA